MFTLVYNFNKKTGVLFKNFDWSSTIVDFRAPERCSNIWNNISFALLTQSTLKVPDLFIASTVELPLCLLFCYFTLTPLQCKNPNSYTKNRYHNSLFPKLVLITKWSAFNEYAKKQKIMNVLPCFVAEILFFLNELYQSYLPYGQICFLNYSSR